MKTLNLQEYWAQDHSIWTLPRLSKPLEEYREALRKAIGFMNEHRPGSRLHPEGSYHDDGSPEYYIRHDLCELAEALEYLAEHKDDEFYECGCPVSEFGCQGYHGV